ncbi:MAG: M1 family metallopeptidase [Polyangiales bacterium]
MRTLLRAHAIVFVALGLALGCGPAATEQVVDQTLSHPARQEAPAPEAGPTPENGRLPAGTTPTRYSLALSINPDQNRFGGVVVIDTRIDSARSVIWMHGIGHEVASVTVTPESGDALEGEWTAQEDDDSFASVTVPRAVQGNVQIEIAYTTPFSTALGGIYKVEHEGHNYAFTQMEPLSARKAFPCFDDPRFKTPFDVTLRVKTGDVAAANSAVASQTVDGDATTIRYATTLPIPTYLFALAVGPLDIVEGSIPANDVRSEPLPFRGLAPHGHGPELAYTMEHTPAILAQLEEYFGIAYPYDKLDFVAVPDFGAGAMENVGLVTYRDTILLVDPATTPTSRMRFWAYIVAHELGHMWFGNLVTMEWWDDLWLNEAFASWIEHTAVAGWREDYEADVELSEWVFSVYGRDSLGSARTIRQPIVSSHDIHNAFDGITYGKGAGVLRMFERHVGVETFQTGIRAYLQANRFGSATVNDLMSALSEAAGRDVGTPFMTFLSQPGLPMVEAALDCTGETPKVTLQQSRYLPVGSTAERDRTWQIPVCVRYGVGRGRRATTGEACTLLTETTGEVELSEASACPAWIHPNADSAGYYRWSLPAEQLAALQGAGRSLTVSERLSVADSVQAGFRSAQIDGAAALGASLALATDAHRSVATAPLGFFSMLLNNFAGEDKRESLQRRLRRAYAADYRRLRWQPRRGAEEAEDVRIRRGEVVGFLALVAEDPAVRREGLRLGRQYLNVGEDGFEVNTDAVPADLAESAMVVAVQDGGPEVFERAMVLLEHITDGQVRRGLLRAVGSTMDPTLAERAMALSLSDNLRNNEIFTPMGPQLRIPERRAAAWAWIQANYEALVARLPPSYAGFLPTTMSRACDTATADAVQSFFESRVAELQGGPRNLASTTETIRLCAAQLEAQRESVIGAL